ncbi:MAG: UDP-N-acetylglucosamine 2-epimerase [Prochlorococcus marinus CUG1439]|uniref:UDP-N-acetylglucosamine 2-epimerase n=1 Tax=Prochlorococcus sp. MIT 1314 TaxID=3096220 RepID=UPI001B1F8816|nr:UDP-N-acetylglucosamine 2-epimerase [Prochlorococcus sp. MIT 1314]MCR8538799.1 UDP-N-acetylglucosamine 2-epimerase [Prochlorococcus marinus CUG1439]
MKSILALSGSRADYYLQRPAFKKFCNSNKYKLNLIVTGGILEEKEGKTLEDIINDNINICGKIKSLKFENKNHIEEISNISCKVDKIIKSIKPDLALVYADRYESFAFALATFHADLINFHVEAGDITEGGTYDDQLRHCISKISHIHACSTYKGTEVLQNFGEEKWRIKQIGLLSYGDMKIIPLKESKIVAHQLKLKDDRPLVICTMHPIPRSEQITEYEIEEVLKGLEIFSKEVQADIIITSPNPDKGNQIIFRKIQQKISNIHNCQYIESLGGYRYHSLLGLARKKSVTLCGNSSSIIKEAPFFKANGLNIGIRQTGREKASTQIDIKADANEIYKNLLALSKFMPKEVVNPYSNKNSCNLLYEHVDGILNSKSRNEILFKKWA